MLSISALIASTGLTLSCYGVWLERKITQNPAYKPFCDISDRMSCTKPILSKYGRLLGISNTKIGAIFYTIVLAFSLTNQIELVQLMATASLVASAALAYILHFKVKTTCPLCISIYATNIALFLSAYNGL